MCACVCVCVRVFISSALTVGGSNSNLGCCNPAVRTDLNRHFFFAAEFDGWSITWEMTVEIKLLELKRQVDNLA